MDMQQQQPALTNQSPNAKPATQQQQAQFDLLLGRSRQVMEASAQEWLSTLKQDPVQGAVTLGTQTLRALAMQSQKAGQPVDPTVLINVGLQLCKDVAAIVNAAGLVSDDQLPAYLKDVMQQSIAEYLHMDAQDGLLSPQDKREAQNVLQRAGIAPTDEPGDASGPDNTPAHENAESPAFEQSEGDEEDQPSGMLARMQRMRGTQ